MSQDSATRTTRHHDTSLGEGRPSIEVVALLTRLASLCGRTRPDGERLQGR